MKEKLAFEKLNFGEIEKCYSTLGLEIGGKFTWPQDKDRLQYMYDRGFDDAFAVEPDLPFKSML